MRRLCDRISSGKEDPRKERSSLPLHIIRMRIPLLTPGEIIVPCIRAAVIESDGEFSQKVANTTYARQLGFLLQNEVHGDSSPYAE